MGERAMWRFIAISFAFLGWSFYELSGGAEYQPLDGSRQHVAALKRAKAEAVRTKLAKMDAEQDARVASAVWPTTEGADKIGISPVGFAVLSGASSQSDTVTRASVDLDSLPRITITRSVAAPVAAPASKVERITLTSNGASAAQADTAQVAQVVKASLDQAPAKDIRRINGNRVNMRMGPGTKYSVASKLSGGTEVEVLQEPGNGWLKLRVLDTGRVGWMADYLVTAAN